MNKRLRFVMVGGFLGAGKTTALARLARFYSGRGQRVGLVTNDQAAYLVRKQLEEADAIVINRLDELDAATLAELTDLIDRDFPGTPVLRVSAKTGQGFDALTALLDQDGNFGRKILDIDYDTYAEGEAEMGWLNSSIRVTATSPLDLNGLLLDVAARLRGALSAV